MRHWMIFPGISAGCIWMGQKGKEAGLHLRMHSLCTIPDRYGCTTRKDLRNWWGFISFSLISHGKHQERKKKEADLGLNFSTSYTSGQQVLDPMEPWQWQHCLPFKAKSYSFVYTYRIWFLHSSVHGLLRCFHLLTIVNNAPVNTGV